MKGVTGRTSRLSPDGRDGFDSTIPGIPDSKWQEFLEREENDTFLLGLREEIVQNTIEKIFENYLEKQAVAFTVYCAHSAWVKVLDVFYMDKDPGDYDDPDVVESWKPDEEPPTSKVDSWASECMTVKEPEVIAQPQKQVKDLTKLKSVPETREKSLESMSFMADLFPGIEEEYWGEISSISSTRKKSIFTRTLSMQRDSLAELLPQNNNPCQLPKEKLRKKCEK